MKRNEGALDRVLRGILAVTAVAGFCPLYRVFGLSTCRVPSTSAREQARAEDLLVVRLPYAYRVAVVLHDMEGLTMREIADLTDVELPAAKQRLRRGRMALVTALAAGHERRIAVHGVPLRCWDARSQVSDYLDGELAADAAARVERHLETCPTCPPLYAALVGVTAVVAGLRDSDRVIEPPLAARIAATMRRSTVAGAVPG